jgi:lysophospholipase L1-like esterase
MTAYGHSWVAGEAASDDAHAFVALAAAELGLEADNRGVGGSHSPATARVVAEDPPTGSAVVVVMTGLNDLRAAGTDPAGPRQYADALHAILRTVRTSAPDAVVVAVEQPHLAVYDRHPPHDRGSSDLVDAYDRVLRDVVAAHPGTRLATVPGWDPGTMLAADTVHPDDLGHAVLARAVVDAVRAATAPAPG